MAKQEYFTFTTQTAVPMLYPALFEARAFTDAKGKALGDPKYGGQFLFPIDSPDFFALKAMVIAAAKAKFPGLNLSSAVVAKQFRVPWDYGSALIDKKKAKAEMKAETYDGVIDYLADFAVVKADSKTEPAIVVVDRVTGKPTSLNTPLLVEKYKDMFYSGVEVFAEFNVVAYDAIGGDGIPGVKCYLQGVCSTGSGERRGGGRKSGEQMFGFVSGRNSAVDPTQGMSADDI